MKKKFILTLGLIFLLVCPVHAQLIDNGNGTISDTQTGITWQQDTAKDGQGGYRLVTWAEALYYCQILDLGGYKDWRLPTIIELESVVDLSVSNPAINSVFFPGTGSADYWSATTKDSSRSNAWVMDFTNGSDGALRKTSNSGYVRAVRGGINIPKPASPFIDNGDGVITDSRTGLIWQKGTAAEQGSPLLMTWEEALGYCENLNLGERQSWRLPTIKELDSIVDLSVCVSAINASFTDTQNAKYWSSTSADDSRSSAWVIDFSSGDDGVLSKAYSSAYVRAVSGGITVFSYVCKAGCGGKAPCYSTIQAALDASENGTVIKIGQGIYNDPFILNSPKTLHLHGGWDSTFETQTANTTFIKVPRATQGVLRLKMVTIRP